MKKIVFIKSLIPQYDWDFFESFAESCIDTLSVFVTSDLSDKSSLNYSSSHKPHFFNVVNIHCKRLSSIEYSLDLFLAIYKLNPDILVFPSNPRCPQNILLILFFRFLLNKKVHSWSMFHRIGGPRLYSELFHTLTSRFTHKSLCYSNLGNRACVSRGIPPSKVFTVGTAINERNVLHVLGTQPDSLSVSHPINSFDSTDFILIQVMRLSPIKKPHLLIDLMELLVKQDPSYRLILIGGGTLSDFIIQQISLRSLNDYIHVYGPIYDESMLSPFMKRADVFVAPTCIGLSAHHSFCYSLPIVTDNSPTCQASEFDILRDMYNSLIYEEGNILDFARKITMLRTNPQLLNTLSNNAAHTVYHGHTLRSKVRNLAYALNSF